MLNRVVTDGSVRNYGCGITLEKRIRLVELVDLPFMEGILAYERSSPNGNKSHCEIPPNESSRSGGVGQKLVDTER